MDWLPPPTTETDVCGYKIVRSLGRGSYGRVFALSNGYALKQERFRGSYPGPSALREAAITASARHPNVVRAHGAFIGCDGFHTDRLSIIEKLADETLLAALPRLTDTERMDVVFDILCGLSFLHHEGILHRDLKPENILLTEGIAMVADFGLSVRGNRVHTVQTLWYKAPEVAMGGLYDERADVWSLGCIMYEMLHPDQPLFGQATNESQLLALQQVVGTCIPQTTPFERLMAACLQFDSDDRPTAAELLELHFPDQEPPEGVWLRAAIQPGWNINEIEEYLRYYRLPSYLWSQLTMLLLTLPPAVIQADPSILAVVTYIAACLVEPVAYNLLDQILQENRGFNLIPKFNEVCNWLHYQIYPREAPWDLIVAYLRNELPLEQAAAFERGDFEFYHAMTDAEL